MDDQHPLEEVLKTAIENAQGDKVSVRDLLSLYDDRSFGPVFALLGLIAIVPPVSGIPGVPTTIGVILLLFSLQLVFGRKHVWLPAFIANLSITVSKLEAAHEKSQSVLEKIDKLVTSRLTWATDRKARYMAAILVSLLALMMIPLELVPFAVTLPGSAIAITGLALIARDGALMIGAYLISAATLYLLIIFLLGL